MNFEYISSDDQLIEFRKKLYYNEINTIAIDFEADYYRHSNECKLCLIQVFDGTDYYIIDPFCISNSEIKKTLEDTRVLKIAFDSGSDKKLILDQYDVMINSVYDLKPFVNVLRFEHKGLDSVIEKELNIKIEHKKKYQLYNWIKRPIQEDAIEYALNDVRYLFELRDCLLEKVKENHLIDQLIIGIIRNSNYKSKSIKPKIFRTNEFKSLSDIEKNRFEQIYALRESIALESNFPPSNIISNDNLFKITIDRESILKIKFSKKLSDEVIRMINDAVSEIWIETP